MLDTKKLELLKDRRALRQALIEKRNNLDGKIAAIEQEIEKLLNKVQTA
jgi:uncharacterized protein YdcH (DUF465 family)